MNNEGAPSGQNVAELTADVISAYVSNNSVSASDLPGLISSVYASIKGLSAAPASDAEKLVPPVSINSSITPDYLISLEDGRRYKALKRHLTSRGLTPAEYRTKWGFPAELPDDCAELRGTTF
jgi:predicted transcriptional regulator